MRADVFVLLIVLCVYVALAWFTAVLAFRRGRSSVGFFFLSLLFPILAMGVVLMSPIPQLSPGALARVKKTRTYEGSKLWKGWTVRVMDVAVRKGRESIRIFFDEKYMWVPADNFVSVGKLTTADFAAGPIVTGSLASVRRTAKYGDIELQEGQQIVALDVEIRDGEEHIRIEVDGKTMWVNAENFSGAAGHLAMASSGHAHPVTQAANHDGDTLSQLERLGKLRETGVLSTEEFEAQKAKVLGLGL